MSLPRIARLGLTRSTYTSYNRSFSSVSAPFASAVFSCRSQPRTTAHKRSYGPPSQRRFSSDKAASTAQPEAPLAAADSTEPDYVGPLSNTFRKLKIFSIASCGLSMTLAPFMFIVESNLPYPARLALVGIAVGSSAMSTSLVAWCAKPYVTTLKRLRPDGEKGGEVLQLTTMSLFMKPRVTTVYDPEFLLETRRPMAKWELATQLTMPTARWTTEGKQLAGTQETVAETVDHEGNVIGRWIVSWGEDGEGVCHEAGSVIRHFNVHEELLS